MDFLSPRRAPWSRWYSERHGKSKVSSSPPPPLFSFLLAAWMCNVRKVVSMWFDTVVLLSVVGLNLSMSASVFEYCTFSLRINNVLPTVAHVKCVLLDAMNFQIFFLGHREMAGASFLWCFTYFCWNSLHTDLLLFIKLCSGVRVWYQWNCHWVCMCVRVPTHVRVYFSGWRLSIVICSVRLHFMWQPCVDTIASSPLC